MSADETAAIIGRMMLERKTLREQEVALEDELQKAGDFLSVVGRRLRGSIGALTDDELNKLTDQSKVVEMVADWNTVRARIKELDAALERAGL